MRPFLRVLSIVVALAIALAPARLLAQSGPATLSGTVANANTRIFLDRAEVTLDGTPFIALTDRDGTYRLPRPSTRHLPTGRFLRRPRHRETPRDARRRRHLEAGL